MGGAVMLLRESIYEAIRRAILACEFEPGQELREQLLAKRYGVSRSPVRDALLRLGQESLLTVLPRRGYLVNDISIPEVEDMFDFRLVITSGCAAGAARADDIAVQALERFRADPDGGGDEDAFLEYNRAFHRGVADTCWNSRLAALEHDLVEQSDRLIRISLRDLQNSSMPDAIREHNAILDAIQAHDPETASRLACQHAESGHSRIMAALRKSREVERNPVAPR
jgi:GntR family transcriptional regulator, rspAB operon transcriptional repressor